MPRLKNGRRYPKRWSIPWTPRTTGKIVVKDMETGEILRTELTPAERQLRNELVAKEVVANKEILKRARR